MAVKSKEELLSSLKTVIGDNPSDDAIALLEDISDTLDNSTGGSSDEDKKKIEELEKQVNEVDETWRKKYTDRFFSPSDPKDKDDDEPKDDDEDDKKDSPKTFEELFSDASSDK